MSHFVRQLFGATKHEVRGSRARIMPSSRTPDHEQTAQRLQRYLAKGSETMSTGSDSPSGDAERHEQREAAPGESYQHLGERVTAILHAADEAADDLRRHAKEDAERTRNEAQQQAAAHMEEAKRRLEEERRGLEELRAQIDKRRKELDDDAESHRQTKRREAEAAAAQIRMAAEETAKRAHGNAILLQRWLEGTIPRFHEVTDWLERVLADAPKTEPKEQKLEETLREQARAKAANRPVSS